MKNFEDLSRPWRGAYRISEIAQLEALPAWLMRHEVEWLWFPALLDRGAQLTMEDSGRLQLFESALTAGELPCFREPREAFYERNPRGPAGIIIHATMFTWVHRDTFAQWLQEKHQSWIPAVNKVPLSRWFEALSKRAIQTQRIEKMIEALKDYEAQNGGAMSWPNRLKWLEKGEFKGLFQTHSAMSKRLKGKLETAKAGRPKKSGKQI